MKRILILPFCSLFALISFVLFGCSQTPKNVVEIKEYSNYEEYLENKAFEIEMSFDKSKATYLFASNSNVYVLSTKYKTGQEYGYIYNSDTNELYHMQNQYVTFVTNGSEAQEKIKKSVFSSLMLFYTSLDTQKFEYLGEEEVLNIECFKYSYKVTEGNTKKEFTLYIDIETSLCLKATCKIGNEKPKYMNFTIKKIYDDPNINEYINIINQYNEQLNKEKED